MGDASLSISLLSPAQSATYKCKVKKSPGVDTRKVSLVVLGKMGNWVASWGLPHVTWLHYLYPSPLATMVLFDFKVEAAVYSFNNVQSVFY